MIGNCVRKAYVALLSRKSFILVEDLICHIDFFLSFEMIVDDYMYIHRITITLHIYLQQNDVYH